jgi:hypothetical protein
MISCLWILKVRQWTSIKPEISFFFAGQSGRHSRASAEHRWGAVTLCGTKAGERKVEGLTSTAPAALKHRGRWGAVAAWRSSGIRNGGSGAWDATSQEDSCRWRTASSGRRCKWRSAGLQRGSSAPRTGNG